MLSREPALQASSADVLLDQPFTVTATGLAPGERVTLRAEMSDYWGVPSTWRSDAIFEADADGVVDLARHAPLEGDYSGVDPMGLITMMRLLKLTEEPTARTLSEANFLREGIVTFTLVAADVTLTSEVRRRYLTSDVEGTDVAEDGLVARFFARPSRDPRPAIIVLGGSEGGITFAQRYAALFASHGYPALALAYFGMDGLPGSIDRVPVETVGRAIAWLQQRPEVGDAPLGIFGRSKGGELALLAATHYPQLRFVIAHTASAYVFQGMNAHWFPVKRSSWSWRGEGLPYVPFNGNVWAGYLKLTTQMLLKRRLGLSEWYRKAVASVDASGREAVALPVERLNGPLLLISGGDDVFWPSSEFAQEMVARLAQRRFPHTVIHENYADAGHDIVAPYLPTTFFLHVKGGTPVANARAAEDSWQTTLAFLQEQAEQRPALIESSAEEKMTASAIKETR